MAVTSAESAAVVVGAAVCLGANWALTPAQRAAQRQTVAYITSLQCKREREKGQERIGKSAVT